MLTGGQVVGEQLRRGCFGPILPQVEHLAVDRIREHRPEPLPFAALDLIEPELTWATLDARPIPFGQERFLRAAGLLSPSSRRAALPRDWLASTGSPH